MKHKFASVSASVFVMFGLVSVAHATSLDEVCNQPPIDENTKVTIGGDFFGNCIIQVDDARLEIVGVDITINAANGDDGRLIIEDITGDEGTAELVIKNTKKITTGDRLLIEGAWDGGVTFKNNHVDTGDDLRVKPVGAGDLIFKNNRGQVVDDIRLGDTADDEGLDGDMDVRNNKIKMIAKPVEDPEDPDLTEFVAQSFDGHINIRNNRFRNKVGEIGIRSAGNGNIGVKNNRFINNETVQEEIFITSEGGDVSVLNNRFGKDIDEEGIKIESETGQCKSKRNRPELVDDLACQNPNP